MGIGRSNLTRLERPALASRRPPGTDGGRPSPGVPSSSSVILEGRWGGRIGSLRTVGRRLALGLALLAAVGPPVAAQENAATVQEPGVLRDFAVRALDFYIRPQIEEVRADAGALAASLAAFCDAPSPELREHVATAFGDVVIAWAGVMALQIEPLTLDSRRERFFFWPDPRGITLRQVQEIIASRDPTAVDPATLPGKSAAIQGIGALEYLLFGTGAETLLDGSEDGRFRCAYASAIGGNLVAIADALLADVAPGSAFAIALQTPGPGNALFPTEADAAADLALSLATAVELARDRTLLAALGTADAPGQPRSTPLWRSGLTLPFAAALLQSAADFIAASDTAMALPEDQRWLPGQIRSETDAAVATLPVAGIEDAAADPDLRRGLTLARVITDNIRNLVGISLPAALGVALGFNALDGDG